MRRRTFRGRIVGLALAGLLAFGAAPVMAQEADESPDATTLVAPPGSDPLGVSYSDWGDQWWEWIATAPAAENPMFTGICPTDQTGEVFFLPQVLGGMVSESACEVGAEQWILASPGGVLWTNDDGETVEEMQPLVEGEKGGFSNLSVTIDGTEVPDIDSYWAVGSGIHLAFGEDNVFGYDPGTERDAVGGGWFVMIPPLEPGSHTIVVRDDVDMGDDEPPQTAEFTANVTAAAAE
jgi:hypothetical protein